jgi:hypothetical protein
VLSLLNSNHIMAEKELETDPIAQVKAIPLLQERDVPGGAILPGDRSEVSRHLAGTALLA